MRGMGEMALEIVERPKTKRSENWKQWQCASGIMTILYEFREQANFCCTALRSLAQKGRIRAARSEAIEAKPLTGDDILTQTEEHSCLTIQHTKKVWAARHWLLRRHLLGCSSSFSRLWARTVLRRSREALLTKMPLAVLPRRTNRASADQKTISEGSRGCTAAFLHVRKGLPC